MSTTQQLMRARAELQRLRQRVLSDPYSARSAMNAFQRAEQEVEALQIEVAEERKRQILELKQRRRVVFFTDEAIYASDLNDPAKYIRRTRSKTAKGILKE